jgi:hypothetical protein
MLEAPRNQPDPSPARNWDKMAFHVVAGVVMMVRGDFDIAKRQSSGPHDESMLESSCQALINK